MFLKKSALSALLACTLIQSLTVAHAEQYGERPEVIDFVENSMAVTNLYAIDNMGLSKSSLPSATRPWSDDYWPDLEGGIARRYEPGFMRQPRWNPLGLTAKTAGLLWNINGSGMKRELAKTIANYASLTESDIAVLSPAEKYDILLGDENFTFTKTMIQRIDDLVDNKLVVFFSGICHGWTGAALSMPRPEKTITAVNPHGKTVTFFPSDIRGLASYLYAAALVTNNPPEQKMYGQNCQTSNNAKYETDGFNRIIDPKCNDVNPAFFHLALINQIGVNRRAFIMDRKSQFAVDNQPVLGYKYTYFNTATGRPARTLDEAKIPLDGRFDPYHSYRPKNGAAKYIVGVNLDVEYGAWVMPGMERTFSVADDKTSKWHTKYDLELNESGEIIGGEWRYMDADRANAWDLAVHFDHPDFMWMPTKDAKAWSSTFEGNLNSSSWNLKLPFPADVKTTALKASEFILPKREFDIKDTHVPAPLATIVDWLIAESRK